MCLLCYQHPFLTKKSGFSLEFIIEFEKPKPDSKNVKSKTIRVRDMLFPSHICQVHLQFF